MSTKNSSNQEIKEITQRYEKQMQDALAVERINQGKILMKKETDFNALLQEQLKSQEDMYKVKLKDMEEKYENQMKLLEQETQHKLDVYKLEMDQIVEKEKTRWSQEEAKSMSMKEEEIRTAIREELAAEYHEQRDELVKMMKSQAEEYRGKLKQRHADQIGELESEIEELKSKLEKKSDAHEAEKNELENSFHMQSEEQKRLKDEIMELKSELAERDKTEAMYREEFEKELEKEMLALTAASTDDNEYNNTSDQEFAKQFEKQWHNELTQSFADDAMKEVDEIIGDTLLEDEDGNYLSMVRSGKNYAIASSTFQLGEIGDDIQLPGAETFDKKNAEGISNDTVPGKEDRSKAPPSSSYKNASVDAKGKLNIENLGAASTLNDNPAKIENDDPLSDLQLEEEQYDRMGSGESGGTGSVPLEEEEETFQITNEQAPEGGKNSILPNETSKEYEERKKENDMALDDTDNGIANDKNTGPKDPTDSGVLHSPNKVDNDSNKDETVEESSPWVQQYDGNSGYFYFVNRETGASQWEPPVNGFVPLSDEVLQEIQQIEEQQKKSAEETAQLESEIVAAAKAKTLEEEAEAKQVTNEDDGNGDLDKPTFPLENEKNGLPLVHTKRGIRNNSTLECST